MNIYKPVLIGVLCSVFLTTTFAASKDEIALWINEFGNRLIAPKYNDDPKYNADITIHVKNDCSFTLTTTRSLSGSIAATTKASFSNVTVSANARPSGILFSPQTEVKRMLFNTSGVIQSTAMIKYIGGIDAINLESRDRLLTAFSSMAEACGAGKLKSNLVNGVNL